MIISARNWPLWGIVAAIWIPSFWSLSAVWQSDPELMHGWAVPLLVIYLLRDRRLEQNPTPVPSFISKTATALLALAIIGKVAGELVIEANPYWPKILWFTNGFAVMATIIVIFLFSGERTARKGVVPLLFTFSALPWPALILSPLTLHLATFNAHAAAEILSAMGFPAAVNGRVIELTNGVVGIDEACSGIRSLQTVTMVAFFLGVLFRFRINWAAGLLAGAWLIALLGNLGRTFYLTWTLVHSDMSRMNAVHDNAGNIALVGTLILVGFFAWALTELNSSQSSPKPENSSPPRRDPESSLKFNRLAISLILLISACELGIQQWYRNSESSAQTLSISLNAPPGWKPIMVDEFTRKELAYTSAQGFAFNDLTRNERWLAYVFNWSGDVEKMGGAFSHDPTVCLPSIGTTLDELKGRISIQLERESVEFNWYRFITQRGQTQHVFFQVFDGNTGDSLEYQSDPRTLSSFRLQLVRQAQQTLNVFQTTFLLEGIDSDAAALEAMQDKLQRIVRFQRIAP